MTKKVVQGDSLKRQRELSSSNNEKEYECLKKRKSEKLRELFGDATLPDSKTDVTYRKKKSSITQNTEGNISSNSGIGFLDALNMVSSGSNKKRKNDEHNKQQSYKTDKQKIRADDYDNNSNSIRVCSSKNDNKSVTTKTTTVDLENHKTKNQSKSALKEEKVAKTDKNQSKHDKKYRDKKEETKIMEHSASTKYKNKSNIKEENMIITKNQHKHNKNDKKNNENKKHTTKIIDKRESKCEGIKEKSSSENILKCNLAITTEKEVSSSSGIGFAEALQMTAINKSKSKKRRKN